MQASRRAAALLAVFFHVQTGDKTDHRHDHQIVGRHVQVAGHFDQPAAAVGVAPAISTEMLNEIASAL